MTDDKLELCIAIAKAEKWKRKVEQHRPTDKPKIIWVRPDDGYPVLEKNLIEHFFDSAEILRMFKALLDWADIKATEFDELITLEFFKRTDNEDEECDLWEKLLFYTQEKYFERGFEHATTKAYLVMLEKKSNGHK